MSSHVLKKNFCEQTYPLSNFYGGVNASVVFLVSEQTQNVHHLFYIDTETWHRT